MERNTASISARRAFIKRSSCGWAVCTARSAIIIAIIASAESTAAEQLQDALAFAYRHNPSLAAERADRQVLGEDMLEARAPGQPRITLLASHLETVKQAIPSVFLPDRTLRSDLSISLPLYRGGAVKYAIKDARQRYLAGWETFRGAAQDLFGAVVIAYCDVLRDEAFVRLNARDVEVLEANLRAARGRFRVGNLTVTDVAQSEARLALAKANLLTSRSRLIGSREEYVRVVGRPPDGLLTPPPISGLPATVEAAVEAGLNGNGPLQATRMIVTATDYRIKAARAERSLRVTGVGTGSYFNYLDSFGRNLPFNPRMSGSSFQIGITLELPLYQGGLPASRVRRARNEHDSAIEQEIAAERGVVAQVRAAFASWRLLVASETDILAAIEANARALKGARAESMIGTRTLLDVLDAEREQLNTQVALVSVRRNAYVASFALLAAMGRAEAHDLGLVSHDAVPGPPTPRASWSDWADGPNGTPATGTLTRDTAVQNGEVPRPINGSWP